MTTEMDKLREAIEAGRVLAAEKKAAANIAKAAAEEARRVRIQQIRTDLVASEILYERVRDAVAAGDYEFWLEDNDETAEAIALIAGFSTSYNGDDGVHVTWNAPDITPADERAMESGQKAREDV
jgi:hypothetical protein